MHEKQDEEDEEAILGLDSASEISDAEDLDFVPQDQAGVVAVSWNPALLNEEGFFDDIEDSLDEFTEEETEPNPIYWVNMGFTGKSIPPLREEQEATTSCGATQKPKQFRALSKG